MKQSCHDLNWFKCQISKSYYSFKLKEITAEEKNLNMYIFKTLKPFHNQLCIHE